MRILLVEMNYIRAVGFDTALLPEHLSNQHRSAATVKQCFTWIHAARKNTCNAIRSIIYHRVKKPFWDHVGYTLLGELDYLPARQLSARG
jgi:hypothetical protein